MGSAQGRIGIANARLAALGEPKPDEAADVTAKREHYSEMLRVAQEELSEAHHAGLPYKDDD